MIKKKIGVPKKYTPEVLAEIESWLRRNCMRDGIQEAFKARWPHIHEHGFNCRTIIVNARLDEAEKWLRRGKSNKWVARKCKWGYPCELANIYKKYRGETCGSYRARYKKKRAEKKLLSQKSRVIE